MIQRWIAILIPGLVVVCLACLAIWLKIAHNLDQPVATVIAACVVPTLGFLGFRYQKFLDRGAAELEYKRNEYLEYIRLANDIIRNEAVEQKGEMWSLNKQADLLFVIAEDEVARKIEQHLFIVRNFLRLRSDEDGELFDHMRMAAEGALSDLISEMRNDLLSGTKFTPTSRNNPDKFRKGVSATQTRSLKELEEE